MDQSEVFTHHNHQFVIEADGWPSEEAAAVIDLQSWALQLGPEAAAALHKALEREREALIHEMPYDRNAPPWPAVREAQRHAIRAGLQGQSAGALEPVISIEAYQVSTAPESSES
jgi:hypothetical protein